ncbi:LysR family transcriptional regulator [Kaistia terrae]|uniref:LysR family transcriptional regulator n=1 Tax=Kaistia terrae TaxID=537017 RepID=A0ABW0PZ96_9HYPH|nr:LysR family transcriptional regulator [Kaistia terrae]MCX5580882.1 LysR family transcriptional regulator [Kaistia terrae]
MNLRSIRYFVAVAEGLSYSRAAEQLNISQSAISRQIQILEDELGIKLFDRFGRGVQLTATGEELLAESKAIVNKVSALHEHARELAGGIRGVLRIGTTPQTLESFVAKVLNQYRQKYPNIAVTLIEDGSANLISKIEAGDVDLAFVALPRNSHFAKRELFPFGALAVLPPGHALATRRTIEIDELANQPLLLLRHSFMTRKLFDGACALSYITPKILVESSSPHGLVSLANEGHGIAIIPSTMRLRPNQHTAALHYEGRQLGLWISAIWDNRRNVRSLTTDFVNLAHDFARISYPGQNFHFKEMFDSASSSMAS